MAGASSRAITRIRIAMIDRVNCPKCGREIGQYNLEALCSICGLTDVSAETLAKAKKMDLRIRLGAATVLAVIIVSAIVLNALNPDLTEAHPAFQGIMLVFILVTAFGTHIVVRKLVRKK